MLEADITELSSKAAVRNERVILVVAFIFIAGLDGRAVSMWTFCIDARYVVMWGIGDQRTVCTE
jgi:hypothetical protein